MWDDVPPPFVSTGVIVFGGNVFVHLKLFSTVEHNQYKYGCAIILALRVQYTFTGSARSSYMHSYSLLRMNHVWTVTALASLAIGTLKGATLIRCPDLVYIAVISMLGSSKDGGMFVLVDVSHDVTKKDMRCRPAQLELSRISRIIPAFLRSRTFSRGLSWRQLNGP